MRSSLAPAWGTFVCCVLACAPARADAIAPCAPPPGVTAVAIPDGVPDAIMAQLGQIALPGQRFDASDVVMTGVNRRYIFVWHRGDHWIVATERGGRGYNDPVMEYALSPGGTATLVTRTLSAPSTVCRDATAMAKE